MCILMGKRLAVFLNIFLLLQFFFGVKMQKNDFYEKMVLGVVFYKMYVQVVTNASVRRETHQTLEICL